MQLYKQDQWSSMNERSFTVLYELVSQTPKTAMVHAIFETLDNTPVAGMAFRVKIDGDRIRWGGQRYGQHADTISLKDATALIRNRAHTMF